MFKRKVSLLLTTALLMGALSACGSESNDGGSNEEIKGKISYVSWNDTQEDQLRATIEGFNELYPDVEVDLQFTPWSEYWTKLEAAASSGTLPDVITMHTIYAEKYANAGMIEELDEAKMKNYQEEFSYENFPEGITRLYNFGDKQYGVPKDIDCVVLAYNKELFDKAGVEYPNENWKWSDLENAAEKLTDKENNVYGYAAYNNMQESWGNLLYQNGGSIINEENNTSGLDDPKSIEAMERFMGYLDKYSPTTAAFAETDRRAMFASGNIAMISIGNWQLNNFTDNESIRDKFDIAPLPAGPDGTKATISNGLAYSVSAQSKNKAAAEAFVAYLGTKDANERAAIGVSIPAYNGVDEVWAEKHKDLYNTDVISSELKNGVQYVSTESRAQWEAALNVWLEKLFNGEIDTKTAFTEASKEMNEILANEK